MSRAPPSARASRVRIPIMSEAGPKLPWSMSAAVCGECCSCSCNCDATAWSDVKAARYQADMLLIWYLSDLHRQYQAVGHGTGQHDPRLQVEAAARLHWYVRHAGARVSGPQDGRAHG